MNITLTLTPAEMDELASILADTANDLEADGREGNPAAALVWKLQKAIEKARYRPAW